MNNNSNQLNPSEVDAIVAEAPQAQASEQVNEAVYTEEELESILGQFNDTNTDDNSTEDNTESAESVITENMPDEALQALRERLTTPDTSGLAGSDFDIDNATLETTQETPQEPSENELLVNLASAAHDDTTTRFRGAPWFDIANQQNILMAGIGGIGSWASLLLARTSPGSISMYDNDSVESVNMAGQLYNEAGMGEFKTSAMYRIINDFAPNNRVFGYSSLFPEDHTGEKVMICGFDNMAARRMFYSVWKKAVRNNNPKECLFIDGRLAAEEFQVICITGDNARLMNKYEREWLFTDAEADETVCSYKQTTYCSAMIASVIANLFVNFCTNLGSPFIARELPFVTEYNASLMYFKTYDNN